MRRGSVWCDEAVSGATRQCLVRRCSVWCDEVVSGATRQCLVRRGSVWCDGLRASVAVIGATWRLQRVLWQVSFSAFKNMRAPKVIC